MAFWVGSSRAGELPSHDPGCDEPSPARPSLLRGGQTSWLPQSCQEEEDGVVYRQATGHGSGWEHTPVPQILRSHSVPATHHHQQHMISRRREGTPVVDMDEKTTYDKAGQAPFFVIHEQTHHDVHPHPPPPAQPPLAELLTPGTLHPPMERTASGISISSTDALSTPPSPESPRLLSDAAAANLVRAHMAKLPSHTHNRHARILTTLISPRDGSSSDTRRRSASEAALDDDALQSLFSAANDLFFANRLRGRVTWDWSLSPGEGFSSPSSSSRYAHAIVGTTALRRVRSRKGGYETLIVLSSPILRDAKYNRRLLISTFLHEMIHSFLFVVCGRKAGVDGGHTRGFREVAGLIDRWVGARLLRLSEMDADLDSFAEEAGCSGGRPEGEEDRRRRTRAAQPHQLLQQQILAAPIWVGPARGQQQQQQYRDERPSGLGRHHSMPLHPQGLAVDPFVQGVSLQGPLQARGHEQETRSEDWDWQRWDP